MVSGSSKNGGCVDRIDLAHDKDKRRAVVNALASLRFL
jgi:hypothetical protein